MDDNVWGLGRLIGFTIGALLVMFGLLGLVACAAALEASSQLPAAIAGVLAVVLAGVGIDIVYRAVTGASAPQGFFDGPVGGFRAAVGVVFSGLLFVAFGWYLMRSGLGFAWVVPTLVASGGAAFKCGAAIWR